MHSPSTSRTLIVLTATFGALSVAFWADVLGPVPPLPEIPLADPSFLSQDPPRVSYKALIARKADLSDFDCYGCHEKDKPPPIRYDEKHNMIIPPEHSNIAMGHGRHGRNNNCYNCHDEKNLLLLQTRDGHELKMEDSTPLCGSCHGPTYRDWDAGAHGRLNGFWNTRQGDTAKLDCVSCHNPHSPKYEGRAPAPAPHALRNGVKPHH